jgi:6-phospho-beta-glucosidase
VKIAVIGGASVRTPLLVHALSGAELPLSEVALFDTDQDRLQIIAALAGRVCGDVFLRTCARERDCIEGADFVVISIRVGGIEQRARDEATVLRYGLVAQETCGAVGFAMAMRMIPSMVRYAREVELHAPHAWIINFTNPVGIITQAVTTETGAKIIGICDTPTELFEEVAGVLGLPSARCHFDSFGLNHLGWLREVYHNGAPQLFKLWSDPRKLEKVYRRPLFAPEFLQQLRLLPTEYLFYYYRQQDAVENVRRSQTNRGAVIEKLTMKLFEDLRRADADPVATYERYLSDRNASYMTLEAGAPPAAAAAPWESATGYDKIALAVIRAICFSSGAVIPLDVLNRGNFPFLEDADVIEVPCVVNCNGASALNVGPMPDPVRDLVAGVKRYERLTVRAAVTRSPEDTRAALKANPLVPDSGAIDRLISELRIL